MRKFTYRLEPLLELRAHYEREWEIKLAEISGKCTLLRNQIESLRTEKAGLGQVPDSVFDIGMTVAVDLYRQRIELHLEELEGRLAKAEAERKKTEASYLAASKDRKIIDKLKDRRIEEYRKERNRDEMKRMDDIAGSGRQRSSTQE